MIGVTLLTAGLLCFAAVFVFALIMGSRRGFDAVPTRTQEKRMIDACVVGAALSLSGLIFTVAGA